MKTLTTLLAVIVAGIASGQVIRDTDLDERIESFNRNQPKVTLSGPVAPVIGSVSGVSRGYREMLQADANLVIEGIGLTPGLSEKQLKAQIRKLKFLQKNKGHVQNAPTEPTLVAALSEMHFSFTQPKGNTRWHGDLRRVFEGVKISYNPKVVEMVGTATIYNEQGLAVATRHASVRVTDADINFKAIKGLRGIEIGKKANTAELMKYKAAKLLIEKLARAF